MITNWPKDQRMFNTKFVEPIYEAAHVLYASKLGIIKKGYYITDKTPVEPNLFVMNELEAFDIDYDWQFETAEQIYKQQFNV
jgi:CMP-N-acetylneuraminic acid synthetase